MSKAWESIKARKPATATVEIDGQQYHLRGMTRSQKNEMVAECTEKGKLNSDLLEARILAYCVCDCKKEPVQVDFREWDNVPADFTGPLVTECGKLCGFDDSEVKRLSEKKSDSAAS